MKRARVGLWILGSVVVSALVLLASVEWNAGQGEAALAGSSAVPAVPEAPAGELPAMHAALPVSADVGRSELEEEEDEPTLTQSAAESSSTALAGFDFEVLELTGQAIAGALACDADERNRCGAPTDSEGRGRFPLLGQELETLRVAAPGYRVTDVSIDLDQLRASPAAQPVVVHLERETRLTLNVQCAGDASVEGLQLELRTKNKLFVHEGYMPDASQVRAGASKSFIAGGGRDDEFVLYNLGDSARVVVSGVKEEEGLELSIMDGFQWSIHEETLAPLFAGEWRDVDVVLQGGPRSFSCRVRSEAGEALAGASVTFAFRENMWTSRDTDEEGNIAFEGVWAARARLAVEKDGYVPIQHPDYALPLGGHAEFELVRGQRVVVRISDPRGKPARALIRAHVEGFEPFGAFEGEAGSYVFDDLPAAKARFTARLGMKDYAVLHDTLVPEFRIAVPVHGSVEVRYAEQDHEEKPIFVALISAGREADFVLERATKTSLHFEWILPGDYEVCFQSWAGERGSEFEDISPRVPVSIRADVESTVTLGQ